MIRLSRSVVGENEKRYLSKVIDEGYLGMGSFVKEFEAGLGKYFGERKVIALSSGSAALHLALMGIGLQPDDEVLVQSLTFVACFQSITAVGGIPVACEVEPDTCTIDLKDAESKITSKTRAIMPVHYASRTGDLDGVYKLAKKHDLRVIEDAAHAFGTIYKNRIIGSFGDIACFSFDGIKNITTGEGGAVVTGDEKVAEYVSDARLLGVHKDSEKRYTGKRSWEFDVMHQGYRYHMSNLFAAIGLSQLERFENEFKPKRQALAKHYHRSLGSNSSLVLFPNDYDDVVPHMFPIRVLGGKRDALRESLLNNGIECGVHYYPNHLLSYYGARNGALPLTEKVFSELLTLPLHPLLTDEEQQQVIDTIKSFLRR